MRFILVAAGAITVASPAMAQSMIDVPIWSNGILGQQAMRSTFDHYDETHGIQAEDDRASASSSAGCSADALPAADRRRMEAEYVRRARTDGRSSADAWVREQGIRFRQQLVAQGVCPDGADSGASRR